MPNGQRKPVSPNIDILSGDARAVIEAEFEEIKPQKEQQSLIQFTREIFQWIKQRLKRA